MRWLRRIGLGLLVLAIALIAWEPTRVALQTATMLPNLLDAGPKPLSGLTGGLAAAADAKPVTRQSLRDALTKIGVLFDESGQLVLNQIEKGIDLVLVVATLADRRLAERDIVDVGWCERHCLPPWSLGPSTDLKV